MNIKKEDCLFTNTVTPITHPYTLCTDTSVPLGKRQSSITAVASPECFSQSVEASLVVLNDIASARVVGHVVTEDRSGEAETVVDGHFVCEFGREVELREVLFGGLDRSILVFEFGGRVDSGSKTHTWLVSLKQDMRRVA